MEFDCGEGEGLASFVAMKGVGLSWVIEYFVREFQFFTYKEGVLFIYVFAWGTWKKLGIWDCEEWEI